MTVLMILACVLLCVSAFMFFGVPYMLLGRAGLVAVMARPEAKFTSGAMASFALMAAITPLLQAALISGGQQAVFFASELNGLSFGM